MSEEKYKGFNKLPKWAQNELTRLNADLEHYRKKVAQINGEEETNVYINSYTDKVMPLPANSNIKFSLQNGDIEVRHKGGILEIRSNSDHSLIIRPYLSNSFYLTFINS